MADNTVQVKVELIDEISNEMKAIRSNIESSFNKATQSSKRYADQQNEFAKKMTGKIKEMGFSLLGIGTAIKSFNYLKQGMIDAGLETNRTNQALINIRATIGKELLPEAQGFLNFISENSRQIAAMGTAVVRGIMLPFRLATFSLLGWGSSLIALKGMFQKIIPGGKTGVEDFRLAMSLAKEAQDIWKQVSTPSDSFIIVPPKPTEKPKQKENEIYGPSIDLFIESQKQAQQRALDQQRLYQEESLLLIYDETARKIEAVRNEYTEKLAIADAGSDLEKILIANRENEIKNIEAESAKERRQQQKETEEARRNEIRTTTQAYLQANNAVINLMQSALNNSHIAAKKRMAIARALIVGDFMSASASSAAAIWSDKSTSIYAKIGMSIGSAAQLTAQMIAAIAAVSKQSFAIGGYAKQGLAMVGEHGPELVSFGRNGYVYDAAQTRGIMGRSSGPMINFRIDTGGGAFDLQAADRIEDYLARHIAPALMKADYSGDLNRARYVFSR